VLDQYNFDENVLDQFFSQLTILFRVLKKTSKVNNAGVWGKTTSPLLLPSLSFEELRWNRSGYRDHLRLHPQYVAYARGRLQRH